MKQGVSDDTLGTALEDEKDLLWVWVKMHARKGGVSGSLARFTPEIFEEHTKSIKVIINRWHEVRKKMVRGVELLHLSRKDE